MLASVAFDAEIISASFSTTLVLTAVLTLQACGVWLDFVLRKGWPLLASEGPVAPRKPSSSRHTRRPLWHSPRAAVLWRSRRADGA